MDFRKFPNLLGDRSAWERVRYGVAAFRQDYAATEAGKSASTGPYSSMKKGTVRHVASWNDVRPYFDRAKRLRLPGLPAYFSVADRAKNGIYLNPKTGATFRAHGGPGYGIHDSRDGHFGWAAEPGAAKHIQRGLEFSGGLWLPTHGSHQMVLGSHGPAALVAELQAATNNKASQEDVLQWVNHRHRQMFGNAAPEFSSLNQFHDFMRNMPVEFRKSIASKAPGAFELRTKIAKAVAPLHQYPHRGAAPFPLASWKDIVDNVSYQGHENIPFGGVGAVVHGDPGGKIAMLDPGHSQYHPSYAGSWPGVNLGRPKSQVPLHKVIPGITKEVLESKAYRGKPLTDKGVQATIYKKAWSRHGGRRIIPFDVAEEYFR